MKKVIAVFCIIIAASLISHAQMRPDKLPLILGPPEAVARMTVMHLSGVPPVEGGGGDVFCTGAASCTATNPGNCNLLCEDFEGAVECSSGGTEACRNTYTLTSSNVTDFQTAHPGTFGCTDKGDYSLRVAKTGNFANGLSLSKSFAEGQSAVYWQFYVYIDSFNTNEISYITAAVKREGTGTLVASMSIRANADGDLKLRLYRLHGGGTETLDGTTTLAQDTWYRVGLYAGNNITPVAYLNGVAEITASGNMYDDDLLTFELQTSFTDMVQYNVYFDNFTIDNSAMAGACNE